MPSATSAVGSASSPGLVYQFRAPVAGPGRGLFIGNDSITGAWQSGLLTKGDLDNDGDIDIITAGWQGTSFTAGLNTGAGQFSALPNLPSNGSINAMTVADVDADGDLDLVWAAHYLASDSVLVGFNNGSGNFSNISSVPVDANPRSIAIGDIDADGDLDLLVSSYKAAGSVSVRINDGTGHFSGSTAISTGATTYCITLGDLDNDGDLDILATNEGNATVAVVRNNGTGSFGTPVATATGIAPHDVVLIDLDKDGDLDFVTSAQAGATSVALGLNNGSASFSMSTFSVGPVHAFALADIDADNDIDLLTLNQTSHTVHTWLGRGTTNFYRSQVTRVNQMPINLGLADLDGDSDIDWLTANGNGTLSPRFNVGIALATTSGNTAAVVSVYPNPARQKLTIKLPTSANSIHLTMTNSIGQKILEHSGLKLKSDNTIDVNVSGITPGVYNLQILLNDKIVTKKIIIN